MTSHSLDKWTKVSIGPCTHLFPIMLMYPSVLGCERLRGSVHSQRKFLDPPSEECPRSKCREKDLHNKLGFFEAKLKECAAHQRVLGIGSEVFQCLLVTNAYLPTNMKGHLSCWALFLASGVESSGFKTLLAWSWGHKDLELRGSC